MPVRREPRAQGMLGMRQKSFTGSMDAMAALSFVASACGCCSDGVERGGRKEWRGESAV